MLKRFVVPYRQDKPSAAWAVLLNKMYFLKVINLSRFPCLRISSSKKKKKNLLFFSSPSFFFPSPPQAQALKSRALRCWSFRQDLVSTARAVGAPLKSRPRPLNPLTQDSHRKNGEKQHFSALSTAPVR